MSNFSQEQKDSIEATRSLVESGDISLQTYRGYYRQVYDREPTLTDEQIIIMIGTSEDDNSPAGWATTMYELETKALITA